MNLVIFLSCNTYGDDICIDYIDNTTDDNNKITAIRWIAKIILEKKKKYIKNELIDRIRVVL